MSENESEKNFFERMNRKQRREFENKPLDEKMRIFTLELEKTYKREFEKEIEMSFVRGYSYAFHLMNEKVVEYVLADDKDKLEILTKMFDLIQKTNVRYENDLKEIEATDIDETADVEEDTDKDEKENKE